MRAKRVKTVKEKQLLVFLALISFLIISMSIIFYHMKQFTVSRIYAQMQSQAKYYVDNMEYRKDEIIRQQAEFFGSRQLSFLADERILDDYDKREALLSVQEKLSSLKSIDRMIGEVILYIPNSGRVITPDKFMEFDETRKKELSEMMTKLGILCVDQEDNLSFALSEVPYVESSPPYFCLRLSLDKVQMSYFLDDMVLQDGGAYLYDEGRNWFLEDSKGDSLGYRILNQIEDYEGVQEIVIDNVTYLVNVTKSSWFGILVQYCSQKTVLKELEQYTGLFWLFLLLALACAVLFSEYTERLVNQPLKNLYDAFKKLRQGDLTVRVSHSSQDEFSYIYENFNHTVQELQKNIEQVYQQKQMVAQAELKQLQAQINPHFLYNSFFLFNGRVQRKDYDGAKALAEYLGDYFLYLTRNGSDTLRLEDELHHAESYARIQECRFASRITLLWEELPKEAQNLIVPRLIIQPILENAYKYGLEQLEEDGILHVFYRLEGEMLQICIENNGKAEEKTLKEMQNRLSDTFDGEITGIVNIHRRLKNYFGEKSGVEIRKGKSGGLLVIVQLPM